MAEKIVVAGDIGTLFRLRLRTGVKKTDPLVDLTGMTASRFKVRRPDDTPGEEGMTVDVEWAAVQEGLPAAGTLVYTTQAGDVPIHGTYIIQAEVEFGGLTKFRSSPVTVVVRAPFKP